MTTAVLIHGCHLQTDGWEYVALGDVASLQLGRVSKGIWTAYMKNAQLIFFGTGASEIKGVKESRFTYNAALQHWRELAILCGADAETTSQENPFLRWLESVSVIDEVSQNTDEEIMACLDACVERGASELILVSSPFHIPRCLQRGLVVLDKLTHQPEYHMLQRGLSAVSSDTNPTDLDTNDVVIVEPAHRGDNAKVPFYVQIRRLFQFLRNPKIAFAVCDELKALIDKYEKRLNS